MLYRVYWERWQTPASKRKVVLVEATSANGALQRMLTAIPDGMDIIGVVAETEISEMHPR